MPIPVIFIGIAAVSGAMGLGATTKAGVDQLHAKSINKESNYKIELAGKRLDYLRKQCGDSLQELGEEKVFVINPAENVWYGKTPCLSEKPLK